MAFQPTAIAACICDRVNADAEALVLIPGGCWHQRAPAEGSDVDGQPLARPYAILAIEPGAKEFITDRSFLQEFAITLAVYGGDDPVDLAQSAAWLDALGFARDWFASLNAKCLAVYPAAEGLGLDPEEKLGHDILVASRAWGLLLHCTETTT